MKKIILIIFTICFGVNFNAQTTQIETIDDGTPYGIVKNELNNTNVLPRVITNTIKGYSTVTSNRMSTVEAIPNEPDTNSANTWPFGTTAFWGPFLIFEYQNIDAFEMTAGDLIKFDLSDEFNEGGTNDVDINREIFFASTTTNGSGVPVEWVKLVSSSNTPSSPRGNTVFGDYELTYTAEANFSFPGGGFMIAIGANGAPTDTTVDFMLRGANSADTSGKFVKRIAMVNNLNDGLAPTGSSFGSSLAGFRLEFISSFPLTGFH